MRHPLVFASFLLVAAHGFAATVVLNPSKDNTLYESATGTESNGAGDSLFVGQTGGSGGFNIRRAVLFFDLASAIPANATIESVTLTLVLTKSGFASSGESVSAFALTSSWGEGTSIGFSGNPGAASPGDATWIHRSFSTALWNNPGGDFDPQASASTTINGVKSYSWSGAGMVEDVQGWVSNSASNFGWILRGDEANSNTALQFSSRENPTFANRPQLTVVYSVVPEPSCTAFFAAGVFLCGTFRRRLRPSSFEN